MTISNPNPRRSQHLLSRNQHPQQPRTINRICQEDLFPLHTVPDEFLDTVVPERYGQGYHARLVPPSFYPEIPRAVPEKHTQEEPGAERSSGEMRELQLGMKRVVLTDIRRIKVEREVAHEADKRSLQSILLLYFVQIN